MIERTTRARECARPGCETRYDDLGWQHPWSKRFCSAECARGKRAAIQTKRKPVSVASKEQAAKRNAGVSIVSGASEGLHAAHVCSRAMGGCDAPECVVALTAEEHRRYDNPGPHERQLDLLPYLVAHQMHDELAHALMHYRCDLVALLERLTGSRWVPVERDREAAA